MLTNMLPIGNVALYNSCSPNLELHIFFMYFEMVATFINLKLQATP